MSKQKEKEEVKMVLQYNVKCKNCFPECKNNKLIFAEVHILNRGTVEEKWIHTQKGKIKLNGCFCGCKDAEPIKKLKIVLEEKK